MIKTYAMILYNNKKFENKLHIDRPMLSVITSIHIIEAQNLDDAKSLAYCKIGSETWNYVIKEIKSTSKFENVSIKTKKLFFDNKKRKLSTLQFKLDEQIKEYKSKRQKNEIEIEIVQNEMNELEKDIMRTTNK